MEIVENIKQLCTQHQVTIPKLEKELGFGNGTIYNWAKSSPSVDKVERVAKYFGVSINRILYGFDANEFTNLANIARGERTIVQFAQDTGIDHNELVRICLGLGYERPPLETVKRIAANNAHNWLFDEDKLLEAAGYISERQGDLIRKRIIEELIDEFEEAGFTIRFEEDDDVCRVHIFREGQGIISTVFLHRFIENGFDLLDELKQKFKNDNDIQTIAAHHDGGDWTEEELAEIERFKEFVRSKRKQKE